jgi:hypothetical protein
LQGADQSRHNLLIERFHLVARQMRVRHASRHTLEINGEYDVQDLLHALPRIFFNDIRKEEWTPSYAGVASKMDYLLPELEMAVEVKKARGKHSQRVSLAKSLLLTLLSIRTIPNVGSCFALSMIRTANFKPARPRVRSKQAT